MSEFIELRDGRLVSLAAGQADSPTLRTFMELGNILAALAGQGPMDYQGDGVKTWEVCVKSEVHPNGEVVPEWQQYYFEDASQGEWTIYGHVPIDEVVKYVVKHGGDPAKVTALRDVAEGLT